MSGKNYITPRGLKRIQYELEHLRYVERPQVVAEVSYAAALGDRSENAEYIYGKKRLRQIDSRIGYLLKCLNRIEVVDPGKLSGSRVTFGATVVVEDEEGVERTYHLFGEHEVDVDEGILSHKSPIARALMGKEEGDGVRFHAPKGVRELEIVEVRFDAQEPLPVPEWKTQLDEGTLPEPE